MNMPDVISDLLDELRKFDRDTVELVKLAYGCGEGENPLFEEMLCDRLIDMLEPCDDPCNCCIESNDDLAFLDVPDEDDDECCGCCEEDEDDEDDEFYGWTDDDEYEDEGEEGDEVDLLSEQLGVNVDEAFPIQLALAVVQKAGSDENTRSQLIQELGKRGKNVAQLTTLVEGL